ncbi:hypothetical protein ACFL9T_01530 [Thermodesulfobacteriota bacterium]
MEILKKERIHKILITLIISLGLSGMVYGMSYKKNAVFIAGLVLVLGGYLLIRRKLKASIEDHHHR